MGGHPSTAGRYAADYARRGKRGGQLSGAATCCRSHLAALPGQSGRICGNQVRLPRDSVDCRPLFIGRAFPVGAAMLRMACTTALR